MKEGINKELIFSYFSGRATAIEKEIIDQWASQSQGKELFFIWLQEWENQNLQYQADVEKGLSRHKLRMSRKDRPMAVVENNPSLPERLVLWWPGGSWFAAAMVLIIVSAGWLSRDSIRYQTFSTSFTETKRLQLADGSKVVINANSSLRIPRFGFGEKMREVYLTGEADFNITHTKDHKRFIVHANDNLDIEVLGTEFNVYARPRGTKVVLNKGKVQLNYRDGRSIRQLTMSPGDLVTMDNNGIKSVTKTENPQNYSAWKAHRFIFENESLMEICHLFEDNFGVKVQIPDSTLARQTISGSFTALNAEELLEILTDDSGLSYQKSDDGKTVTLTY
ncbi:FecR domain-containing protein [Dyadobacter sp. 32]|uniref:FecR family protein n=1 Tax=Dyadobacter sp. 32 TaxID=538966 RepID=UPI0011F04EC9